jgi:2',3'-cyclic-nucleotide 2'-phosphodiesterase (5'-nucleotidase family)
MRNHLLYVFLIFISSCTKQYVPVAYHYDETKITDQSKVDEKLWSEILPYKDSLDKEMNVILAISDTILTKSAPESDLGNFMCDLILKKSQDYYGGKVDFTFLNNGGIRIPNLPKGNITLGKIIELMPFENRIVIMRLNGVTLDSLFNHMAAKGGWQVSGARYNIQNGKSINVEIAGEPLNLTRTYTVAVSDYLAQGGDNCEMLKGIK